MARPRKIIPDIVGINMVELASKILKMNDAEIGAWLRKAVGDCINGCQDPDCDPFIKVQYEKSLEDMRYKQNIDAQTYRRRLERQGKTLGSGKPDCTTSTNDTVAEVTVPSAGGSCTNIFAHADARQSKVSGAEDGDTSDCPLNPTNTGSPQGVSTADALSKLPTSSAPSISRDAGQVSTPQKTLAGEIPEDGLRKAKVAQVSLSCAAPASDAEHARSDAAAKRPYGTCGHVMLTDTEGHHLREAYGKNLAIAIDILDAYAENNPKKFAKYKNHAAVLRKGNWVWNKVQEMILNEKRIENASKGPRNWKAEERERTARVLRGESADGKGYVRDDELTPAELEAKYG